MHSDSFLLLRAEETDLEDIGHRPLSSSSSFFSSAFPQNVEEEPLKEETWLPQLAGDLLAAPKNPWAFCIYLFRLLIPRA